MPHITHVRQKKAFKYVNRAAPNSATDIVEKTVYVCKVRIANRTGAAVALTLADRSGTPIEKYEAVPIAANSVSLEVMDSCPEEYVDGITLTAGTADALSVTIEGFQEP